MSVGAVKQIEPVADAFEVPPEPILRLSVDKYHEMIKAGILGPDDPVELLEGWLVQKMPKNPPHWIITESFREYLYSLGISGCFVNGQSPFTTPESEPEPDVAIVRGTRKKFAKANPRPRDMAMVIEVADSSLARDRGLKKRIYARAKVPVYWIINLVDRCLEAYTQPSGPQKNPDYGQCRVYRPSELTRVMIDGQKVGEFRLKRFLDEIEP